MSNMSITYAVKITIVNTITNEYVTFIKNFTSDINVDNDKLLYDNNHILNDAIYVLDLFPQEISDYCEVKEITTAHIEIDEYEISTITERAEVYFENPDDPNVFTLKPCIKCYIYPKEDELKVPTLIGEAVDSNTIIWTWPDDENYMHYLVTEPLDVNENIDTSKKIIATIPIGATQYIETGLEPNTPYTRRLINYTATQTSLPSGPTTITTETVNPTYSLSEYFINREQDWTITDKEREFIQENLEAFHSGVGDLLDCKVYKQSDTDFYEKFKGYFVLSGTYTKREKRYEQVNFRYKLLLDAVETIEEQEGYVDFKLDVYPWQEIYCKEYLWATMPVNVYAKVFGSIQLFKTSTSTYEDEIEVEYEYEIVHVSDPTLVVLALDLSSSMRFNISGTAEDGGRQKAMKKACTTALNALQNVVDSKEHKPNVKVVVIGYGRTSAYKTFNGDTSITDASDFINGSSFHCNPGTVGDEGVGDWTNWNDALYKANDEIAIYFDEWEKLLLFFSDGFPNTYADGSWGGYWGDGVKNELQNDISIARFDKSFGVFCCQTNQKDPDDSSAIPDARIQWNQSVRDILAAKGMTIKEALSESDMETAFANALIHTQRITGTTTVKAEVPVESVETKIVNLESEILKYQFNGVNTPVRYNPITKKAEIFRVLEPVKMPAEDGSLKSIKTLLEKALEEELKKPENDGYTTGNVKDGNGNIIGKVFKNIHVKDTYSFADEDDNNISGLEFNSDWQYGKMGSVNTYVNLMNVSTEDHSDDKAIITNDSYVWINGYTEGIIYDGIRVGHANVCKYVIPKITMFFKNDVGGLLKNRLAESVTYGNAGGTVNSSNVSKEVWLMKTSDPNYAQVFGNGIDQDMTVEIDKVWSSPRVDYRFNLLDPNAYTPYYELLPECNPQSVDKHCVVLTVYKAENVFVNSKTGSDNYIDKFDYEDPVQSPKLFEYGLNSTWDTNKGIYDCDGHYINQWLHFQSAPMLKTQEYHDQLPPEGQELYYGMVNGRYRENNHTGKQDLIVEVPQFNIPTTVLAKHADSVKIYIEITEMSTPDALIEYQWRNENPIGSGYTKLNGDYVTFTCESPTMVDIEYTDTVSTYQTDKMELFDQKPFEIIKQFQKPETEREYEHYNLEASTDNGDVMVAKCPSEIFFDENNICDVPITYQGIVNATSKWAPRIHNGYFYFNQHEQYIYSEFDVQANFEQTALTSYGTETVFVTFKANLWKDGGPLEQYSIDKDTKVELLQDEANFTWIDKTDENPDLYGLTLKPTISGFEYKHYEAKTWTSPPISFKNCLTADGPLTIEYLNTDGSNTGLEFLIRYYDSENGQWQDWKDAVPFTNGTKPSNNGIPLSPGYQVRTQLSATENHTTYKWDDYLCCYLDWCDYLDENLSKNINTSTDHISVGPLKHSGTAISKILDFGCKTGISLSMYANKPTASIQVAYSDNKNDLILENVKWQDASVANTSMKHRYWRFKIEIPYKVNVYWVHIDVKTLKSDVVLPYIKRITMDGEYLPEDIEGQIQNLESFEITADGNAHKIVESIGNIIDADIIEKGFTRENIKKLEIINTNPKCYLIYDDNLSQENPNPALLDTSVLAAVDETNIEALTNTPYIKTVGNQIKIVGTPQQFCPITVESENGVSLKQIYGVSKSTMKLSEMITISEERNYIQLKRTDFEKETLQIWVNEEIVTEYEIVNHLIFFKENLNVNDIVTVSYNVLNSFYAEIDRENNTTTIVPYENKDKWIKPDETVNYIPYEGMSLYELYLTGVRFSNMSSSSSAHARPDEEEAWYFDTSLNSFVTPKNTESFNGFIATQILSAYTHEVTLKSNNNDDDINGVIIGYIVDNKGLMHTLSYLIRRNGVNGAGAYQLIYDFLLPTQKVIVSIDDPSVTPNPNPGWSNYTNGIRVKVEKQLNSITCIASYWNNPSKWNEMTKIEFNTESLPETTVFSNGVQYGYCNQSQADSYFIDIKFQAYITEYEKKLYKIMFETSTTNNKYKTSLSMNPIYRTDYEGFIYATYEHNEPYKIRIFCTTKRLKRGGQENCDINIEVVDILDNPIINKEIDIDCLYGTIDCSKFTTDENGVVHLIYTSCYNACTDVLTVKVLNEETQINLEESIEIIIY